MWKMGSTHILLFTLALLFEFGTFAVRCPCKEKKHCQPIQKEAQFEVFTFDVGGKAWKHYDWSKVTTIAAFGPYDEKLMCFAHSRGVRVVLGGAVSISAIMDPTNRTTWINKTVSLAKKQFMDGINLDIEQPVVKNSPQYFALTALVNETTDAFHKEIPGSQVSFDVASSPKHSNRRDYDYKGIADSCDLLFVMSYDIQSCGRVAGANSPYNETLAGYEEYINIKIDPKKLVMGVPWYGYDYLCLNLSQDGKCTIQQIPHAGKQIPYSKIMKQINNSTSGKMWDNKQRAPYYNYKAAAGCFHQVWYDDPKSISLKAAYVNKLGLRGIGMWNGNFLDYSNNTVAQQQTRAMWHALWHARVTTRDTASSGVAPEEKSMPLSQQATVCPECEEQ